MLDSNITLLLRIKDDLRALIETESTREDSILRLYHIGYMQAVCDVFNNMFSQLADWKINIPDKTLQEMNFAMVYNTNVSDKKDESET